MPIIVPFTTKGKNNALKEEIKTQLNQAHGKAGFSLRKKIEEAIDSLNLMTNGTKEENEELKKLSGLAKQINADIARKNEKQAKVAADAIIKTVSAFLDKQISDDSGVFDEEDSVRRELAGLEGELEGVLKDLEIAKGILKRDPTNFSARSTIKSCHIKYQMIQKNITHVEKILGGITMANGGKKTLDLIDKLNGYFDADEFTEMMHELAKQEAALAHTETIIDLAGENIYGIPSQANTVGSLDVNNPFAGLEDVINSNSGGVKIPAEERMVSTPAQIIVNSAPVDSEVNTVQNQFVNSWDKYKIDFDRDNAKKATNPIETYIDDINDFLGKADKVKAKYEGELNSLTQILGIIKGKLREKLLERQARADADLMLDRDIDILCADYESVDQMFKLYLAEDATLRKQVELANRAKTAYQVGKTREALELKNEFLNNFQDLAVGVSDFTEKVNNKFNDWRKAVEVAKSTEVDEVNTSFEPEMLVKNEDKYAAFEALVGIR